MKAKSLAILAVCACCGRDAPATVTLFAASSLQEVASACAEEWSRRAGRPIRAQFGASSTLATQIAEGAEADLFVSADAAWADRVRPADRYEWFGNRLVVVVRKEAAFTTLADAASLALGGEAVPVGKLAHAALDRLGVTPKRVIYGANVRDVLAKVVEGAADAGIVYATDAAVAPEVRVAMELEERTRYVVALLTPAGRDLFQSLREPWCLEIARQRGFVE
ncbi:MAG: molybdate ABC transporter substrate-binding protein [Planctomycetota bacterium]